MVNIAHGEYTAVLSLYKYEEKETWLLTGWKRTAPGEPGSDSALSRPTHGGPTLNRPAEGAGATEKIISPGEEDKRPGRYSIRPADQADIEVYRGKYLAHAEPQAPRGVAESAKGLKDRLVARDQSFYDQVVDRWAA